MKSHVYMVLEDLDIVASKICYRFKRVHREEAYVLEKEGWRFISRFQARQIQKLLDEHALAALEPEDLKGLAEEVREALERGDPNPPVLPPLGIPHEFTPQVLAILFPIKKEGARPTKKGRNKKKGNRSDG